MTSLKSNDILKFTYSGTSNKNEAMKVHFCNQRNAWRELPDFITRNEAQITLKTGLPWYSNVNIEHIHMSLSHTHKHTMSRLL